MSKNFSIISIEWHNINQKLSLWNFPMSYVFPLSSTFFKALWFLKLSFKYFETFRCYETFRCSMSSLLSRRAQALCGVFTVCCTAMAALPRQRDCKPSKPSEPLKPSEPSKPSGPLLDGYRLTFAFLKCHFRWVLFHFQVSQSPIGGHFRWLPSHFSHFSQRPLAPTFYEHCLTFMFLKGWW